MKTTVRIKVLPKREPRGFGFEKVRMEGEGNTLLQEEYRLTVLAGQSMADGNLTIRGGWNNVSYRYVCPYYSHGNISVSRKVPKISFKWWTGMYSMLESTQKRTRDSFFSWV